MRRRKGRLQEKREEDKGTDETASGKGYKEKWNKGYLKEVRSYLKEESLTQISVLNGYKHKTYTIKKHDHHFPESGLGVYKDSLHASSNSRGGTTDMVVWRLS